MGGEGVGAGYRGMAELTKDRFRRDASGTRYTTGDLGVRIGFARAWGLDERPTPGQLEELGDPYRPSRSVVAWYCWRAADTTN